MKNKILLVFVTAIVFNFCFSQKSLWMKTSKEKLSGLEKFKRNNMPNQLVYYVLDYQKFKNAIKLAPRENPDQVSNLILEFPNPNGKLQKFKVFEAPVMEAGLMRKFPNIRAYLAVGIDDPSAILRFSVTDFGLHVISSGKSGIYYIDSFSKNLQSYIVYSRKNSSNTNPNECLFQEDDYIAEALDKPSSHKRINDGFLREYRTAIAVTNEYSQIHMNIAGLADTATEAEKKSVVLSAVIVTLTRVNSVFEKDLSVRMNLVENNDRILFVNPDVDDGLTNNSTRTMLNQVQRIIDAEIGTNNYDIGHGFCTVRGGVAQISSVCGNAKSRGVTGQSNPVGDIFDIDFVAHEIGHQYGATHTQNNACNRHNATAYEPGSGSSIMGYAGICAPNVQAHSDPYFHTENIDQMTRFILNTGICATRSMTGNIAPEVDAGSNYTIPLSTAFKLTGQATDANPSDNPTYSWEQKDNEVAIMPPVSSGTRGPSFRSLPPSDSPIRFFPPFHQVLNGNLSPMWEVIPSVRRNLNFTLTVRDNNPLGGLTNKDNMRVIIAGVGPFRVTSPVLDDLWISNSTQTVTWDVAGTTANGINTDFVKISISTDGGQNFVTLLENAPNDGSQEVQIPNESSENCRIMIEAQGNIYYAVSQSFKINHPVATTCKTFQGQPMPIIYSPQIPESQIQKINVAMEGTITSVKVNNKITHSLMSDVITDLGSPANQDVFVKVVNRVCGNLDGIMNLAVFDGGLKIKCNRGDALQEVYPSETFSGFNGQNPNGDWTFRAYNKYGNTGVGNLNSWSLEICTEPTELLSNHDLNVNEMTQFLVYPNPNNGSFDIRFKPKTNTTIVSIYDLIGKLIFHKNYINGTDYFNKNISHKELTPGSYILIVQDGDDKVIKKIIVK